jgi:hypothetical protein
MEEPIDRD